MKWCPLPDSDDVDDAVAAAVAVTPAAAVAAGQQQNRINRCLNGKQEHIILTTFAIVNTYIIKCPNASKTNTTYTLHRIRKVVAFDFN